MSLTKRKCAFGLCADSKGPDQTVKMQSDQGLHCPLTESLDTTKYMESKGLDYTFASYTGWSESAHFVYVRKHFFASCSLNENCISRLFQVDFHKGMHSPPYFCTDFENWVFTYKY